MMLEASSVVNATPEGGDCGVALFFAGIVIDDFDIVTHATPNGKRCQAHQRKKLVSPTVNIY